MFTHFHALAAVTVSIRLSYSRGSPVLVRPRGSIPISLPCRALTARGSLERQFRNGTRPGHRFHVFLICVYYITIKPVCQPQILPRLAALHTLSSQKVYAREGRRFPRVILSKGGYAPPLYPPARGRSHLPVRSAQNALHRRAAPPCNPSTRRGSAPLAPPKGSLVLDLLQKGFPKNNTRLRLPLPARLCRATSPTGGGKSRLPLWGSCHGISVTERGEPGTYSRPQPKNPAGEAQRNFPVLSGHRLKSRSALGGGIFRSSPHESSCTSCNLLGQEPLGSLQNSHFAPQNRGSCGLLPSNP